MEFFNPHNVSSPPLPFPPLAAPPLPFPPLAAPPLSFAPLAPPQLPFPHLTCSPIPPPTTPTHLYSADYFTVLKLIFIYIGLYYGLRRLFNLTRSKVWIEILCFLNMSAELYVTSHAHFEHHIMVIIGLISALSAVLMTLGEVIMKVSKHLPLKGKCLFREEEDGLKDLRPSSFCEAVICSLRDAKSILMQSSRWEKVKLAPPLLQLMFRCIELACRSIRPDHFYLLKTEFSLVSIVLSVITWATRRMKKRERPTSISCIIVGNAFIGRHPPQKMGPSNFQLLHFLRNAYITEDVGFRNIIHQRNFRFSDVGSTETVYFNFLEVQASNPSDQANWRLPSVDFVLIYFSVLDRSQYESINQWVDYLDIHAPTTRRVLVGDDSDLRDPVAGDDYVSELEGIRAAYDANAVCYEEVSSHNHSHLTKLLKRLVDLATLED